MKKIALILFTAVLAFAFSACEKEDEKIGNGDIPVVLFINEGIEDFGFYEEGSLDPIVELSSGKEHTIYMAEGDSYYLMYYYDNQLQGTVTFEISETTDNYFYIIEKCIYHADELGYKDLKTSATCDQ